MSEQPANTPYTGDDFPCDQVLNGQVAVEIVRETPNVLAFHHTRPYWPVHIVVVPKRHVPSLLDADDALVLELMKVVQQVARDVTAAHGACFVRTNIGAYQDSKHLHWYIAWGERLRGTER